jgi:hypothetical protein
MSEYVFAHQMKYLKKIAKTTKCVVMVLIFFFVLAILYVLLYLFCNFVRIKKGRLL